MTKPKTTSTASSHAGSLSRSFIPADTRQGSSVYVSTGAGLMSASGVRKLFACATLWRSLTRLKQRLCKHEGYLDQMQRLSDHEVICPCVKCGKVLSAFCGLDLPITWIGQKTPR